MEFKAAVEELLDRFREDLEKSQKLSDDQYKPYREIHDFGENWEEGGVGGESRSVAIGFVVYR